MASLITELINTLEEQNNIYELLLDIASKKKVAIIENNVPQLQAFVAEENTIVGKNQRLEKKRIELFNDISIVLSKTKDMTLKELIESIKGQAEEKILTDIMEKLLNTLPKLKSLNDQNQELLQMSMDHIDFSVNLIRGGANQIPTYYDSSGNEINLSDKKMFDTKQ